MIALLGAGCGSSSTPGTPTTGSGSTGGGLFGGGSATSACAQYYAPAGTSITYKTSSGAGENPYTITITENSATRIKLRHDITVRGQVSSIDNELTCEGGRVIGQASFDLASSMLGFDVDYEVLEQEGDEFPATIAVGTEWTAHKKVKMTTSDTSQIARMMNGAITTTDITTKVVAEESITVPAGTFTAFKLQQTVKLSQAIGGRPVTTTSNTTSWFVKGLGTVKTTSGTGASAFSMEAQSVTR